MQSGASGEYLAFPKLKKKRKSKRNSTLVSFEGRAPALTMSRISFPNGVQETDKNLAVDGPASFQHKQGLEPTEHVESM